MKFLSEKQEVDRQWYSGIEQRSGERVRRLVNTEPNANATHRFFEDRL